jgi:ADP-ribosylglycohydrolase
MRVIKNPPILPIILVDSVITARFDSQLLVIYTATGKCTNTTKKESNMLSPSKSIKRATASLFGLAFGDAFGAKTEFMRVDEIMRRFPPNGPRDLPAGQPVRVTDDTQMTIAVGQALITAEQPYSISTLEPELRKTFVDWFHDPENNRAPGRTCLDACSHLDAGQVWHKASIIQSKGCGANMRVAPVGLLTSVSSETRAALAQFQAALTHGHPTALAASDLTAFVIAELLQDRPPETLPQLLRQYAQSQHTIYHEAWLGPLWKRSNASSPEAFIQQGWNECLHALDRLDEALNNANPDEDPCLITGEGWIAEEALMTALLCFLFFPDDPLAVLHRAAVSSGDSDSIACLAGAFVGAHAGINAWPTAWFERIEYKQELTQLGNAWDQEP